MDTTRVTIDVPTRAPGGATNAYVLGADDALLVDPAARHDDLDALTDRVAHVALTHHHPDHTGAVAHYAEACDATVWARTGREAAFEHATGLEPDRTFAEGTSIPIGGGPVTVLDTPGHAPEHVGFVADEAVAVGDLAVQEGSVVVGDAEGDMRAYLTSLRRLHAMNPNTLLPGHGPVIDDPRATCERLIRHRYNREARVLAAVEEGATTVEEILAVAYEKDLSGVEDLAKATVRAHLEKLDTEGRVRWDGERARHTE